MAVSNLSLGYDLFPDVGWYRNTDYTFTGRTVDAADEYIAGMYKMPVAGDIAKIGVPIRTIATTGTFTVRVEGIGTDGKRDSTLIDTNASGTHTLTDPDDEYSTVWVSLTSAPTVTVGQAISIVIVNPSTSPPSFTTDLSNEYGLMFPYNQNSIFLGAEMPQYQVEMSDGSRPVMSKTRPLHYTGTNQSITFNGYHKGNKFKLPFNATVRGLWGYWRLGTGTPVAKLFDSDGSTVLASVNLNQTYKYSSAGYDPMLLEFSSNVTLYADTWYYVALESGSSTCYAHFGYQSNVTREYGTTWLPYEADIANACYQVETTSTSDPTSTSDWTETTTQRIFCGVILEDISDAPTVHTGTSTISGTGAITNIKGYVQTPYTPLIECGDIYAPYWATYQSGAPSFGGQVIDAEGEKAGFIVEAPKTGTITKVHTMLSTITTAPTADYDIRLETVGTSDGLPTGTLFDTNTNGALTIIAGDDDEWLPVTLTAGASVTRGDDVFAVVLAPPASPDTGNLAVAKYFDGSYGFPYACFHNGSVWAKATYHHQILLEYSDGSIPRIPNCFPWTSTFSLSALYSDSSSPYRCNRFKLREDAEIVGIYYLGDMDASDITATLYEGNSTVRRTLTLKKHHTGGSGGDETQYAGYFSTPFNASADTLYRVSVINNYATASGTPITVRMLRIYPSGLESKIWDHMPYAGLFSEFYYGQSSDLSSWSDFTDRMSIIGPIIRSIG